MGFDLDILSWRSDYQRERQVMSDALVYGFAASGALALLASLLLPTESLDVRGTALLAIGALVLAWGFRAVGERLPLWGAHLGVILAIAMITVSVPLNGDPQNNNELLYLFIAAYAFYFFSVYEASAYVLLATVAWAPVQASLDGGRIEPSAILLLAGVMATLGALTRMFAIRGRTLVASLSAEAMTDHLTGLWNRRGLQRLADQELQRISRGAHPLSLLVADLDHFKAVNDRLGHLGGDTALERVGAILREEQRSIDRIARIGGEEFAILLPETGPDEALLAAERLRATIKEGFSESAVPLTISIGVGSYPTAGTSWEELLLAADKALYAAKEFGRDRVVVYSDRLTLAPSA